MNPKKMMSMVFMMLVMIVSIVYTVQGVSMHNQVQPAEDRLHAVQDSYFSQSKEVSNTITTTEIITL